MIDEAVADGDYTKAVGKEIMRLVKEKAGQKEPAANPPAPPAPPPAKPSAPSKSGLSAADKEAAAREAADLWKEVEAGELPIEEVQEVRRRPRAQFRPH